VTSFNVPWGLIADVLVVLLLFGASFHLHQGRQVLANDGCEVYWQEFKDGYEGQLVNRTEAENFQEHGSISEPETDLGGNKFENGVEVQ